MDVEVKIDPGICNFLVTISAASDDGVHVDIELVTECESIMQLARLIHEIMPIDAYQELGPKESLMGRTINNIAFIRLIRTCILAA